MNFSEHFVRIAQRKVIKMDEKKKVNTGIDYKNKKWRPSIFINADKRESIERWFTGKGYKSFNEYVCALIDKDMRTDKVDHARYSDQAASADCGKLPWEE